MTAESGGDSPDSAGQSPASPVLDRPGATLTGPRAEPRPLDQIFPPDDDVPRAAAMQEAWTAFCREMDGAVRAALDKGRSPAEVAYGVGEIVHNFFRTRGTTLTSYELRRLVAELIALYRVEPPPTSSAERVAPRVEVTETEPAGLVSFAAAPAAAARGWSGDAPRATAEPVVPESVFEPPPSRLVNLLDREASSFDRLLMRVVDIAGAEVNSPVAREAASVAIDRAIDRVEGDEADAFSPEMRRRLAQVALSELCGLGPIDRLWFDRAVRSLFINGPDTVFVERAGGLSPAAETFRDEAHLTKLLKRLVARPMAGVAEFRLRDGTTGTVVFPPAAPKGPVLAMRRPDPGTAKFDRLIAAGLMAPAMADLLRLAARSRLKILVAGQAGAGKTSLLAALAHDMEDARVVTVARDRAFGWASGTKVELVATDGIPFPAVLAAGFGLQPHLLVVDAVRIDDIPVLVERLARASHGTVAAIELDALAAGLAQSVDIVVRLTRGSDGAFRVVSVQDSARTTLFVYEGGRFQRRVATPSFASAVVTAGFGDALTAALR